ncbi:MAG TPA: hypothetical protein EYP36_00485, partial [Calditrichaeota bacterium]|nr:hypothetical protein [Calditrichota bacterium]
MRFFFIHRDSGLLIQHISGSQPLTTDDQDIIAGMLTAIRDFASTAFKTDTEQEVNEIQYNDFQIILESGRKFYLAIVVSGIPDRQFYSLLHEVTREVNKKYSKHLRQFEGDTAVFSDSKLLLQKLIVMSDSLGAQEQAERKPKGWLYIALLGILILILYFGWFYSPGNEVQIPSGNAKTVFIQPLDYHKFVLAVNEKAGTAFDPRKAPFKLIYESGQLIIRGAVATETIRRQVSAVAAEMSDVPVIINELKLEQKQMSSDVFQQRIERTVLYYDAGKSSLSDRHKAKLDSIVGWLKRIHFKR